MGPDTPSVAAHSALVRRHPIRFSGSRSSKLDNPVAEPLTDDELRAMLKACRGPDLRDKRDEALIRLMFTTGARAGEVVAMETQRLGPAAVPPTVIIRRGKGGKGRVILLQSRLPPAIDNTRLGGRPLVPRRSGIVSWRRRAADAID
jgi:site-specific recombinase XerD